MNKGILPESGSPEEKVKRITPSNSTRCRLYANSGNMCAFPGCDHKFFDADSNKSISNICHIEAAEEGGERFNPNMTNEERAAYENLILLCPNCHVKTNDVSVYTVGKMREMKQQHEDWVRERVSAKLMRNPALLADIVNQISMLPISEEFSGISVPPRIENKISYNNVVRYKRIIEERTLYQFQLDHVYNEMDQTSPGVKHKVLQFIRKIYLNMVAGKNIDNIREESDILIDKVIEKLRVNLHQSTNYKKLSIEEEVFAIDMIVIDAFLRCKVLEEPQ